MRTTKRLNTTRTPPRAIGPRPSIMVKVNTQRVVTNRRRPRAIRRPLANIPRRRTGRANRKSKTAGVRGRGGLPNFPGPLFSRAQDIRSCRGTVTQSWIGDARLAHKLRVHFAIASCSRLTAPDLQALPKTPLWEKLEREGRLDTKQDLESNARFLHPRGELASRDCLCLRARTRVRPLPLPSRRDLREPAAVAAKGKLTRINLKCGLALACNIICRSESCRTTEQRSGARRGLRSAAVKSRQFLAWASSRGT
jgi:hypothetical protein